MEFSPNLNRTALHNENLPDGPLSPRQRTLADAIHHCSALADTASAPAVSRTQITVCEIALGTPKAAARLTIEIGLAWAEAELKRLRGLYECYGAEAFMPRSEPDPAPRGQFETRHAVLVAIMRRQSAAGRVMTRAGDSEVTCDASGAYVL